MDFKLIKGNLFDNIDKNGAYICLVTNSSRYNNLQTKFFLENLNQKEILKKNLKPNNFKKHGYSIIIDEENKPIVCYLVIKSKPEDGLKKIAVSTAIYDMREKLKKIKRWNNCIYTIEYIPSILEANRLNFTYFYKEAFRNDDVKLNVFYNIKSRISLLTHDVGNIIVSIDETESNKKLLKLKKYLWKVLKFIDKNVNKIY